jgi:hypothetical protein
VSFSPGDICPFDHLREQSQQRKCCQHKLKILFSMLCTYLAPPEITPDFWNSVPSKATDYKKLCSLKWSKGQISPGEKDTCSL